MRARPRAQRRRMRTFRIMESFVLRLQAQFMRDVEMILMRERMEAMRSWKVLVLLFLFVVYGCWCWC
jgi:hypothetical protein